jgi:DNA-binding transcriptional MerR regulator/predicted nucleic acid-binding protein
LSVLLADKSALEWARRDTRARAAFLTLRSAHVIAACHMTALEICYSARDQKDLEALLAGQRALEWLPVSEAATDRALEVQRLLAQHRGNGHRRPIPDLIIAATAELHGHPRLGDKTRRVWRERCFRRLGYQVSAAGNTSRLPVSRLGKGTGKVRGIPAARRDRQQLLGIGAAAARAGVSERALRYYQQLGLLTPCASTPGGMRRYSQDDLARVARIRQLQALLGLDLDEIVVVLDNEDRMAQIRHAYHHEHASDADRREMAAESLRLQRELRAIVQAKRQAIDSFVVDLDARIARTRDLLDQMTDPALNAPACDGARARPGRPRDPNLESRVFAAALRVYAEAGWSGFSFDAVARRAGVGKAG